MLLPVLGVESPLGSSDTQIARDLSRLTAGQIRFSAHDRMLYATDASLYQVEPIGVVVPASTREIPAILRYCSSRALPVLPRAGGTSLAGQCTNRAIVLDLSPACRSIGSVEHDATVWVEPGVTIDELNREVLRQSRASPMFPSAPAGLFFAPDPATTAQACIGGCIGNNSAGARSIRYGRTSENLAAIDVLLSTGEQVTLAPNAGAHDAVARRLARGAIHIAQSHAGLIRERFPRTVRRNAGFGLDLVLDQIVSAHPAPATLGGDALEALARRLDLSGLLCGSEGTLAITTRAKLKLHPLPSARGLAVLSFASLEHAIDAVKPLLDIGLPLGLSAVELLDDVVLEAAMGNIEYRRYVELLPGGHEAARGGLKAVLYVEFFGFGSPDAGAASVRDAFASLEQFSPRLPGLVAIESHTAAAAMLSAWKLRKAGEPLLHGLPGRRKPVTFVEDNAVPVERLAQFVHEFKRIVARHGTRAAYWAHASVGVLHVRPMIDLHDPADRTRLREIAVEVADLARSCGGIMSGEHGDGRVRGPLLERFFGPELMRAFADLKRLFDPPGILNPGNIVGAGPVESITDNLRTIAAGAATLPGDPPRRSLDHPGPERYAQRPEHLYFDYADQHGFRGAVEACNGAGLCRKRAGAGGTMCPSYMALLDERHATRGRGNALRLAITGQFPSRDHAATAPNWTDPDTIKTLDLCLSCKACKSECPSNVDIARLKAEYTAQRYRQQRRIPLTAALIGRVRFLNRLGSIAPGLANWCSSLPPLRALLNRVMNLHPARSLPRFDRSLYAWMHAHTPAVSSTAPTVVLFADCFTAYNEPHVGIAAVRVLEHLGFRVALLPGQGSIAGTRPGDGQRADLGFAGGCCGRSMISVGMLDDAIQTIDRTLGPLAAAARDPDVKAIVVCEPSCLSAIKDDWLQLRLRTPIEVRRRVADMSMLVEEFVAAHLNTRGSPGRPGRDPSAPPPTPARVLFHAHCHQKALWGSASSAAMLEAIAPGRVHVLDAGCCGMAGSFGYAAHRFDLSNRIGELALFPAVRSAAGAGAVIAATGTSCRHQLHDATGSRAVHPIELAATALGL
ncbi:MAG: FAD-binding and (Fe-S)-binding domain-containing protein [Phycisphaerales bacterium]